MKGGQHTMQELLLYLSFRQSLRPLHSLLRLSGCCLIRLMCWTLTSFVASVIAGRLNSTKEQHKMDWCLN